MTAIISKQKRYCVWRYETIEGRLTKVPYCGSGRRASSTNQSTWMYLPDAKILKQRGNFDGIGIMLGMVDGVHVCGIDIDNHHGEGDSNPLENEILELFKNTYSELSPSGKGVHLLFTVDDERMKSAYDSKGRFLFGNKPSASELECYLHSRYLTLTMNKLNDNPIVDQTNEFQAFLCKYMERKEQKQKPKDDLLSASSPCENSTPAREGDDTDDEIQPLMWRACRLSPNQIEARLKLARTNERFEGMFARGDLSSQHGDASAADLSLCGQLAFWMAKDPTAINETFKRSALYRPQKWERFIPAWGMRYGEGTITRAIYACKNCYDPENYYGQRGDKCEQ